ncbi:MAG: hypothetical protein OXE77_11645 [Flavobacteriaceae bacterium]|nr:hypothetical protein [Flavobacteriaceae bacterium]MCY4267227.1 hypothetical protein [Flavobacteriaceae bacterium]MCY4299263.1 hypothetical protein [Flavobacteriaceae bacterium]
MKWWLVVTKVYNSLFKPQEFLSPKRLKQVLAFGHDMKKRYYQQRCHGFDPTIKTYITLSI